MRQVIPPSEKEAFAQMVAERVLILITPQIKEEEYPYTLAQKAKQLGIKPDTLRKKKHQYDYRMDINRRKLMFK